MMNPLLAIADKEITVFLNCFYAHTQQFHIFPDDFTRFDP